MRKGETILRPTSACESLDSSLVLSVLIDAMLFLSSSTVLSDYDKNISIAKAGVDTETYWSLAVV